MLHNLTFRRVQLRDNFQCGAVISPAGLCGAGANCTEGSSISIRFEDCSIEGGRGSSTSGLLLNGIPPKITGLVQADRLRVTGTPGPAIVLANKAATGASFSCSDCVFENTAWMASPNGYDETGLPTAVVLGGAVSRKGRDNGFAFGGARLDNCRVATAAMTIDKSKIGKVFPSPPLLAMNGGGRAVEGVSGSFDVSGCHGGQCCALNVSGAGAARQLKVQCEAQAVSQALKSDDLRQTGGAFIPRTIGNAIASTHVTVETPLLLFNHTLSSDATLGVMTHFWYDPVLDLRLNLLFTDGARGPGTPALRT